MNELIKIEQRDGIKTVSARDLHAFLENRDHFATWIKDRISQFSFTENQDFVIYSESSEKGRPSVEYAITIDMAKELSMVERNEKGKMARQYFIECERIARSAPALPSYPEALRQLADSIEANRAMVKQIEADRPKVEFAEAIESTAQTVEFGVFAKTVSRSGKFIIGRNKLYEFLRAKKILMDGFKSKNLPYQKYIDAGWFEVVERSHENLIPMGPRGYILSS